MNRARTSGNTLDLLDVLDTFLIENYGNVSSKLRNQHRGEINGFLKFLGRQATADDLNHATTLAFREWLARNGYSHATIRQYFQWIRRLWNFLCDKGVVKNRPPTMGKNSGIIGLCDAPILQPLIEVQTKEALRELQDVPLPLPLATFGVSDTDMEHSRTIQFEQAEEAAWGMLKLCETCERRFVPGVGHRKGNPCCGRKCYLAWYRKANAERYAGYTEKWRNKE